jgi:hypothetical protein
MDISFGAAGPKFNFTVSTTTSYQADVAVD